jgi:ketosteroid isomerase-like protein
VREEGRNVKRSPELEDVVSRWFAAATRGDASAVDDLVSAEPGTCLIGSDPAEWLRGGQDIADFLRGEVTSAGGHATFTPRETEAYQEGSVGWATTRLTISLPDGQYISPRWSAVFHREGEAWRFVQTHASIGVGNEAAGWTYPP